jgi:N-acetylneuraminic acid mutarotase
MGGYSNSYTGNCYTGYCNDVFYASINSNGTIGSWNSTTAFPSNSPTMSARDQVGTAVYNGYLYVMGGMAGSSGGDCTIGSAPNYFCNGVFYAPINTTGTIGSWTATTSFPSSSPTMPARDDFGTAVYDGYLYVMGGYSVSNSGDCGGVDCSGVFYASINSNGTIGSWNSTTAFPSSSPTMSDRYDFGTAVYNGYLYVMGGYSNSYTGNCYTGYCNDVFGTTIAGAGAVGSWTASTGTSNGSLPVGINWATSVVYNGYVYEIGGDTSSATSTAVVEYAALTATGALAAPGSCAGTITGDWCASTTTATGNLPAATQNATSVIYNGYLYEIGGGNPAPATAIVDYTAITSTGALAAPGTCAGTITGDWCASTSTATGNLPAATQNATSVIYNGYVYEIGGFTTTLSAIVEYTAITSTGALAAPGTCAGTITGDWCASTSTATGNLPAATNYATSVVYNSNVYEIGGDTAGGYTAVVDYAAITSTGALTAPGSCAGTITGDWCASTSTSNGSLPTATYYATSVAYNGYVYEIGGDTGSFTTVVYYAAITSTGALTAPGSCAGTITGDWCASTSTSNGCLPVAAGEATSVIYNGYGYEIGGDPVNSTTNVVSYALINNGGPGTLSAWTSTGSLPSATDYSTSVAYNGYAYEIGGSTTAATATVDYAAITASGALASPGTCAGTLTAPWCASTSTSNGSLPSATYKATSVVYNGYVYEIGGWTTAATNAVYYAAINSSTGAVGTWTATGSLPAATYTATSVAYNGYLYQIGGYTTAATAVVDYAAITNIGAVGSWTATTSLPLTNQYATSVAYNGFIYEVGGLNSGTTRTTTVDYAGLQSIPRVGRYSMLVNLGTGLNVTPAAIVINGTNTGNYGIGGLARLGGVTITYENGTAACSVLSSPNRVDLGSQEMGAAYNFLFTTDGCGNTTNQGEYAWVLFNLDDSQTATFPDINGNHTTVTAFQIFYHPASSTRLMGGMTLQNGVLQSLDAPPKTTQ